MVFDIKAIAQEIGVPVQKWPGNCYSISRAILKVGIIAGEAQYGHWLGSVSQAPGSYFGEWAHSPFIRHGWISATHPLTQQPAIIDPTRWVFESAAPYIWAGPQTPEYDPCGSKWRDKTRLSPPLHNPIAEDQFPGMRLDVRLACLELLNVKTHDATEAISNEQCFWLANLSLNVLGEHGREIFQAIIDAGFKAFIPYDNRKKFGF